ncbi:MAG TPA: hypothetical protein VGQ30_06895, partial [Gemmatimonadaceae bacterium]|nr:hypothetical protein [Gemmatimonadaceae bacterium]
TITTVLLNSLFEQDTVTAERRDVLITNPTTKFENLNFSRSTTDSLIEIGRVAARAAFASSPCLSTLHTAIRVVPLPVRVKQVGFSGVRVVDGDLVLDELGVYAGDSLNIARLDRGIHSISQHERYRGLWLQPEGSGADVTFHVQLDPAPQRSFGGGVAFDQFMSGRIWFGGIDRTLLNGDAEAVAIARLGTYEQDLDLFVRRRALIGKRYVPFTIEATVKHELIRLFSGSGELPSAETREYTAFIGFKQDPKIDMWTGEIGVDARLWHEPARNLRGTYGIRAAVYRQASEYEMGTIVEAIGDFDYQRGRFETNKLWRLGGGFDMTARVRAGWGNRLPLQQTFALGGDDGFAGYRIGELRGSQEAFGSVLVRKRLTPSLHARVEFMSGEVADGSGVFTRVPGSTSGELFGGIRIGLEAATPVGPIRVEEGVANTGQRAILIRVGKWF